MPSLTIQLNISADEMLKYYRGDARTVHAVATNEKTVQFPATALQKHVTENGVQGFFDLVFDEEQKFVELRRATKSDNGLNQFA